MVGKFYNAAKDNVNSGYARFSPQGCKGDQQVSHRELSRFTLLDSIKTMVNIFSGFTLLVCRATGSILGFNLLTTWYYIHIVINTNLN